ncbi:CocE/NonD family hydrolase [Halarchaeum sp. P4]|uniref:CocE/NonD family hydrolase n=1 Tax=Halarchaeum sp. P4 TaxID=3421639 RepID=UPI003EBE5A4A
MRQETVLVPGARRVEATRDAPEDGAAACVVACPPHPRMGGHRGDGRLTAVSDYCTERGVACLRVDYGEWDDGYGEREDARNALRWAAERYDRVGLYGFSFGGGVAALAAADVDVSVDALALLAPVSAVGDELDAAAAIRDIDPSTPVCVVYGERDDTADWQGVVDAVRERGGPVRALNADHSFVGQQDAVAEEVGSFLVTRLTA